MESRERVHSAQQHGTDLASLLTVSRGDGQMIAPTLARIRALLLVASTLLTSVLALDPMSGTAAAASSHLRIAISLSDVPILWAAPDGGFEGVRFGGYTLFDPLVLWDLSSADKPSRLVPGLAESWSVDPAHPKRWTFKLRSARFHDGTAFDADAAVWNLEAFVNRSAPQYNPSRGGLAANRTVSIATYG
jgi:ABC-type transport system substrate-binding protein